MPVDDTGIIKLSNWPLFYSTLNVSEFLLAVSVNLYLYQCGLLVNET